MKAFGALLLLAVSVPAAAGDNKPAADALQQGGAEAPKKERKVCKREMTGDGLYGTRRVCLTAAQWRERNRNAEDTDASGVTARQ